MCPEILFLGMKCSLESDVHKNKDMEVLPLHKYPEYMQQCCDLINSEWKRSETARMRSFESSCDFLPTNLILVQGNKSVIGHCKLSAIPSMRDSCFLESVVIEKSLRGQGLGRYLMQEVEKHCKALGLQTVYLSTKDKRDFYVKLGYTETKPVSIYGQFRPSVATTITPPFGKINFKTNAPPPPPLPPDSYTRLNNCNSKVFMSKNV